MARMANQVYRWEAADRWEAGNHQEQARGLMHED